MTDIHDRTSITRVPPGPGYPAIPVAPLPQSNGIGLAGFILALCGLLFVPLAVFGIIFGAVGLRRTKKNPDLPYGGLSLAAVIISSIQAAAVVVVVVLLTSALQP
jgi:hypothetical protein